MSPLKRSHHTVSKFYFAGFANESKEIRRTPLGNPEAAGNISIAQASVVRDFYLLPMEDGTLSDGVENIFMEIESEAARGFRALVGGREFPIRFVTRGRIAHWLALQHLRGTKVRSVVGKATEARIDLAGAKYFDTETVGVHSGSVEHTKYIRDQLRVLTHELFIRPWMVVDFETDVLSTCDHPVVWVSSDDDADGTGGDEKIVGGLLIPLSRRVGLRIGENKPQGLRATPGVTMDARVAGTKEFAQAFNNSVFDNAWDTVFTHPDDAHLTRGPLPLARQNAVVHSDYEQWQKNEEQSR